MLKKWVVILLGFVCMTYAQNSESIGFDPVEAASGADLVGGNMAKPETKVLKNMLNSYNMARQIATGLLEDINAVINVAYAVQGQINAVERLFMRIEDIARRCEELGESIKDFKFDMRDPVGTVINLEEQIFQKSDDIILMSFVDLPNDLRNIRRGSENVWHSMVNVKDLAVHQWDSLKTSASGISWFAWMVNAERDSLYRARRDKIDDVTKRMIDNDGGISPLGVAQGNMAIRRNELIMNYGIHELQGERITYLSELLLRKTEGLSATNRQRYALYYSLVGE